MTLKIIDHQLKEVFILSLISIAVTFSVAYIGFSIYQNTYPNFFGIWNRWDTPHYLDIAENGYQNFGESRFFIIFFPLYPFVIKIFHFIFRDYLLSALIVSNLAFIIALIFFYKLVLIDYQKRIALRTIFYFTIFPTAYFLHAGYSESLFLAISICSFYYARKEKWLFSGILGMLASLTRINGIILLPALFIEYLHQKKFKIKDIKINILWLLLVPLSLIFYLLINYFLFGNALMFLEIMKSHWYKVFNWPWVGLIETIKSFNWRSVYDIIMVSGAEISFALLGLFLIIFVLKYLRPSYSVYAIFNWLMITSTSFWLSIPRYTLCFFPVFIILAIFSKYPALNKSITIIFLMLYTTFLSLFIQGRWAF